MFGNASERVWWCVLFGVPLNGSSAPSTFSAVFPWRATVLFSAAGLASGLLLVLLRAVSKSYVPDFVVYILLYGYGLLFAAFMIAAGAIACKLKWITAQPTWYQICLSIAITAFSYPMALIGGACVMFIGEGLSDRRHFSWVVKVLPPEFCFFLISSLIASVLVWIALGVVQGQRNTMTLLRLVVLGASWGAVFTVIANAFESRHAGLAGFWIELLLSIGAMLFGGVCGHALATASTAHGSSAEQDVPGDVHEGMDERAGH